MTDREALLREVCANPDDDLTRLVFADWLQENRDEARGEFIRLQVHMAQFESHAKEDWPSWQRLCAREQEFLSEHDEEWWAGLPDTQGYKLGRRFVCGFVESVHVFDWTTFVRDAGVIFTSAPVRIGSFDCVVPLEDPAAVTHFARFRKLRLLNSIQVTEADVRVLTDLSLPGLEELHLRQLSNRGLRRQLVRRFGDRLHCYQG